MPPNLKYVVIIKEDGSDHVSLTTESVAKRTGLPFKVVEMTPEEHAIFLGFTVKQRGVIEKCCQTAVAIKAALGCKKAAQKTAAAITE